MHRSKYSRPRRWLEESGQLHASVALHPGKLHKRLGGPQKGPVYGGEENSLLLVPAVGSQFSGRQAHSLVTMPTELLGPDLKVSL
jgi:hypothetical protein